MCPHNAIYVPKLFQVKSEDLEYKLSIFQQGTGKEVAFFSQVGINFLFLSRSYSFSLFINVKLRFNTNK
jgi:hypothetical protein